jgi:hypothetical protein
MLCFGLCLQENVLPPSYYLMKNILDVQPINAVEWHSCPLGCNGWRPTPASQWQQHAQDTCPRCQGKRFKNQAGRLVPSRVRHSAHNAVAGLCLGDKGS